jgi:multimeric flavodoxin WrbA
MAWKNKIAAGFTNSGSISGDKLNSLVDLAVLAAQHGMVWVGLDLYPGWASSTGSADDLNRLGSWLGVMAQSHVDQGPEKAPPASDLATAEHLGPRVATLTHQWARGRVGRVKEVA